MTLVQRFGSSLNRNIGNPPISRRAEKQDYAVMAGFFPVYFRQFWSAGAESAMTTARLGTVNSAAGLDIALLAPLLGSIADRGGQRKRMLFGFTLLGASTTFALFFIAQGHWLAAALLVPEVKSAEYFGFYNMVGKFGTVIGPALMGGAALFMGTRGSILSLLLLFVGGGVILWRVRLPSGQ